MDPNSGATEDLKAFNRMVLDHEVLSSRLVRDDHDYLQWRQAMLYRAFRARRRSAGAQTDGKRPLMRRVLTASVVVVSALFAAASGFLATLRRKDVVVFSVDKTSSGGDHDFRLDGIYRFLHKNRLSFVEVFHTQLGKILFANAFRRGRPAVYREGFVFLEGLRSHVSRRREAERIASGLTCEGFRESDRDFVRQTVRTLLLEIPFTKAQIAGYRRMLRRVRPRLVLAIDDTRYYQEICSAAAAEGVPLHAFQHGGFTARHAGWLSAGTGVDDDGMPTALEVWSPYWKRELLRLGTHIPKERIRIGGIAGGAPDPESAPSYVPPQDGATLELLVPFETDAPHEEIGRGLRMLLKEGNVRIWMKVRPDMPERLQLERYGFSESEAVNVFPVSDHRKLEVRMHAVMGTYSTFLYDAIADMIPVVITDTSVDFGHGMVENGLADRFGFSGPDPVGRLRRLCMEASPELRERFETYFGGAHGLEEALQGLFGGSAD